MRLGFIVALGVFSVSVSAQQFHTKAFADQNFHSKEWKVIERYGKSEVDIVKMGHDQFIKWYCDPNRAGVNDRIQAEKAYGLALTECNAPLLLRLSHPEQKFMEDLISGLADMAKSSFVTGILSTADGPGWSLPVAESSTAVAATIHAFLNPAFPFTDESNVSVEPLFAEVTERLKSKRSAAQTEGSRLKVLAEHLDGIVKQRSPREKAIVRSFTVKMLKLALLSPS